MDAHIDTTFVARDGDRVVGAAALEVHEDGGLLRSVVVHPAERGTGLGRRLVRKVLELADARQLHAVYLLTTTAPGYFPKLGFTTITRADVPPGVRQSVEFTSACPASAIVMARLR